MLRDLRLRWWSVIGLGVALAIGATLLVLPSYLSNLGHKHRMQEQERDYAELVAMLRTRYGDNTTRPELPPEGSPKSMYPCNDEIARYHLQMGVLFAPTNDDARWALQVAKADLEWSPSVRSLCFPNCLGGGPAYLRNFEPQVSQELQEEIVQEFIRMIVHPRGGQEVDERWLATIRCLQNELWRFDRIRYSLAHVRELPEIRDKPYLSVLYADMDRSLKKQRKE